MLNKEILYQIVSGQSRVSSVSIDEIEKLIQKYPFFQTAWMLKGKAYFDHDKKAFQEVLPRIALKVNDRAKLYAYLYSNQEIKTTLESDLQDKPIEAAPKKPSLHNRVDDTSDRTLKKDPVSPLSKATESVPKGHSEKSIQELIKEKQAKLLASSADEKLQEKPKIEENDSIPPIKLSSKRSYKEILDEDKEMQENISDVLKWQVEQTKNETNLKILPDDLFLVSAPVTGRKQKKEEVSSLEEDDFQFDFEDEQLLELDAVEEDFIEESVENEATEIDHEDEIELVDDDLIDQLITQNTSAYRLEELPEEEPNTGKSNDQLIDQFIESEPKIVPKADFSEEDLEDISAASIEENEGYITDTLAKIYVQQGKLDKALSSYEKLILKYPEKKAYFTAQIEKIKAKK